MSLVDALGARGVRTVLLQFADILGTLKSVSIPLEALEDALRNGIAADGGAVQGFVRSEEREVLLRPDPLTACLLPGPDGAGTVARLLCDLVDADGTPFPGCSREVLRRVLQRFAARGLRVAVALAPEFFLFRLRQDGRATTEPPDDAGYYDLSPGDRVRHEIEAALREAGLPVRASYHEAAPGQHQIALGPLEPLAAADALVSLRLVARQVARRHGLHASFMPKPVFGTNGSGMHVRQQLRADGHDAFADPSGPHGLSETALAFIAGQLAHARGYCAVTNPLVNSYKRLMPGYDAPVYVTWSSRGRAPLIRIPARAAGPVQVELRNPDPACNPYLALAVVLAAGLDGLERGLEPPPPIDRDLYELSPRELAELGIESLPGSLGEAVEAMLQDDVVLEALGEYVVSHFVEAKQIEWDLYRGQVHGWELEQYLEAF